MIIIVFSLGTLIQLSDSASINIDSDDGIITERQMENGETKKTDDETKQTKLAEDETKQTRRAEEVDMLRKILQQLKKGTK